MIRIVIIIVTTFIVWCLIGILSLPKGWYKKHVHTSWQTVLFVLMSPIYPIAWVVRTYRNHRYRNRPRPVPKKFRKWLKSDLVIDGRDTVTIEEYNQRHHTSYTLRDVYGWIWWQRNKHKINN